MGYHKKGFTLLEIMIVMVTIAGLFFTVKRVLLLHSISNQMSQMAQASLAVLSKGTTFGYRYGRHDSCFYGKKIEFPLSTKFYKVSCTNQGAGQISVTAVGQGLLSGLAYQLTSSNGSYVTQINPPIASYFSSTPPTTINCIVGDLEQRCVKEGRSFIPS